ncbi:MAG TPA: CHAT domain-containing protein [Pyrinomonadaceae bacterium]|nr:CHAT domain-containing protein [Pyrinomonadaceae bacterium]
MKVLKPQTLLIVFVLVLAAGPAVQAAGVSAQAILEEADRLRGEQLEASNLQAADKYREAANLFLTQGELRRATSALRNSGELLHLLGKTSESLACYKQALALTNKTGDAIERGKIFNGLADLHFILGDIVAIGSNARRALDIGRRLRNREIEAAALGNFAESLSGEGKMEEARAHQQQALEIWRELNNTRGQAIASTGLGFYYRNLGKPEQALRSYVEALSLAQHANDRSVETLALISFANFKRKCGYRQEALELYATAKRIAEQIGDQISQGTILGGMGNIHFEMGNTEHALHYLEETTKIMERNGSQWGIAEAKLELGRIHRSLDNNDQARRYLLEALDISRSIRMPRLESATLRALGQVYDALGDNATALQTYKSALKLTRPGEDQHEEAYTLNYISRIYEKLNQHDRALKHYNRALVLSRKSADPAGEALTLFNLAHLKRDRGNLREAKRDIEDAVAIVESQRSNVSSHALRTSYLAQVRNIYELNVNILMRLHNESPASGFNVEAFAISEKARMRSFLESVREARANVRAGVDPLLLSKEKQLNEALNTKAQLHVQLLAAKQNDEAANVSKELDTLVAELANVRDQIRQASPQLATLSMPDLLTLKQVQQRVVDDETVLLEFVLGDEQSYAWVVTRTGYSSHELPGRAKIEESALRLHKLFTEYQPIAGEPTATRVERQKKVDAELPAEIAALGELVLGPLAGELNKRRLLIVADGALQYVPFQLLRPPGLEAQLIYKHVILNLPSASLQALLTDEAARRKRAVNEVAVLADPVFEADDPRLKSRSQTTPVNETLEIRQLLRDVGISPDGVQIPRLIASQAEAEGIMAAVPASAALKALGFAANRERVFREELATYRIVHFATHGIINNERPELSGIVLSLFDSEGRSQNGFLRLHEIYNLRLAADLVVLSACSTGLGKDVRGEGMIGLTRGFMSAGASGVVASLWKVDDDATAELMKHFYDGMFRKRLRPAAALREAQLAMSKQKRWQSPYYWAGFVIQGQSTMNGPVTEPHSIKTQTIVLATFGGLLVIFPILVLRRRFHGNHP